MEFKHYCAGVIATFFALAGCTATDGDLDCQEAASVLAGCADSDQDECGDDSAAAQMITSGDCQTVADKTRLETHGERRASPAPLTLPNKALQSAWQSAFRSKSGSFLASDLGASATVGGLCHAAERPVR